MSERIPSRIKTISRWILGGALIVAGFNHFRAPDFYVRLIPDYLPLPDLLNVLSGVAEIGLGAGLLVERTRKLAAWGIVAMLLAFLPVHLQPFFVGECMTPDGPCLPMWAWIVRLAVLHPVLIAWALWHRTPDTNRLDGAARHRPLVS